MRLVFLIEIIEVGGVLEIVRVDFAAFHHVIGLHIVGEFLHVKRDFLLRQNLLDNRENFGVRNRRCRDGNRLTLEGIVIHRIVIAVGRVCDGGNNLVLIFAVDEIHDLLTFQRRGESFDLVGLLVALLDNKYVDVGGIRAFQRKRVLCGTEFCLQRVIGVDHRVIHVGKDVGNLGGFDLFEFDVLGVILDIKHGSRNARAVLHLDVAEAFQQKQRPAAVGRVIGNGNRDRRGFVVSVAAGGRIISAGCQGKDRTKGECRRQCKCKYFLFHNVFSPF